MVGHQHIGMKLDCVLLSSLTGMLKVEPVIVFSEETSPRLLPRWMRCTGIPASLSRGRLGIQVQILIIAIIE